MNAATQSEVSVKCVETNWSENDQCVAWPETDHDGSPIMNVSTKLKVNLTVSFSWRVQKLIEKADPRNGMKSAKHGQNLTMNAGMKFEVDLKSDLTRKVEKPLKISEVMKQLELKNVTRN